MKAQEKKPPLGSGERFRQVEEEARRSGARDPAAVAAAAGGKKYGKKKMAELAARGRVRKSVVPAAYCSVLTLSKSGRGNIEALRDWVGQVGFAEAVPKVARALGISEERAKRIVGKLKGMANRAGTLRKEHSYDPEERAEAKARKSFKIIAYY